MTILNLNFFRVFFAFRAIHTIRKCNSPEIKYPKTSSRCFFPQNFEILPKINKKVTTAHNFTDCLIYCLLNGFAYLFTHMEQITIFLAVAVVLHSHSRGSMWLHSNINSIQAFLRLQWNFDETKRKEQPKFG